MDFGWAGDVDVVAATDYLAGRDDVEDGRIGLVGMSIGGEEAIGASGAVTSERWSPKARQHRSAVDESWLSDAYGVRGAVQEQLEKVQDLVTSLFRRRPASCGSSRHGGAGDRHPVPAHHRR